jgi:hypothetical protein
MRSIPLLLGVYAFAATASAQVPRIVNGTPTERYPTAGALLFFADPAKSEIVSLCSATLIGCRTAVTAAHCVCAGDAFDAQGCFDFGLEDPRATLLFLPQAGLLAVESMTIHPEFSFAERGDIAVIKLADTATAVAPSPINTSAKLPPGTRGTLVGYGRTGGGRRVDDDSGIKREGPVTTSVCTDDIPAETHLCWEFLGNGSSTCTGDSGGPMFVDIGGTGVLAGVTSGGLNDTCLAPDLSFQTDVFIYRDWIAAMAQEAIGSPDCSDLPVGSDRVRSRLFAGTVDAASPQGRLAFEVPAGTARLRVALAGQFVSSERFETFANDFDLYVRSGSAPTRSMFDCRDISIGTFGFCEHVDPAPGTCWSTTSAVWVNGR